MLKQKVHFLCTSQYDVNLLKAFPTILIQNISSIQFSNTGGNSIHRQLWAWEEGFWTNGEDHTALIMFTILVEPIKQTIKIPIGNLMEQLKSWICINEQRENPTNWKHRLYYNHMVSLLETLPSSYL